MPRLVDRNRSIPNGLVFAIPGLPQYQPPRYPSFNNLVQSAMTVLRANPHVAQRLGWSLNESEIAARIDEHNATICKAMGWSEFFVDSPAGGGTDPAPFITPTVGSSSPGLLSRLGSVAAAAPSVLVATLNSKEEAVPKAVATMRAQICLSCPKHEKGDWLSFFTIPVSEAIRGAVNTFTEWNLTTEHDKDLAVCGACDCPMRLKVHFPIERIAPALSLEQKQNLWEKCWIKIEGGI